MKKYFAIAIRLMAFFAAPSILNATLQPPIQLQGLLQAVEEKVDETSNLLNAMLFGNPETLPPAYGNLKTWFSAISDKLIKKVTPNNTITFSQQYPHIESLSDQIFIQESQQLIVVIKHLIHKKESAILTLQEENKHIPQIEQLHYEIMVLQNMKTYFECQDQEALTSLYENIIDFLSKNIHSSAQVGGIIAGSILTLSLLGSFKIITLMTITGLAIAKVSDLLTVEQYNPNY